MSEPSFPEYVELAETASSQQLDAIIASGLVSRLTGAAARDLGQLVLRASTDDFTRAESILRALRSPLPFSVMNAPEEDTGVLISAAMLERALALDLPLQIPAVHPRMLRFDLSFWAAAPRDIPLVGAHPYFGEALIATVLPSRYTTSDFALPLAIAARHAGFDRAFAHLDAMAATWFDTFTLGAIDALERWLEALTQPAVLQRCPRMEGALRGLTVERLLRNQLRGGVLAEWGKSGAQVEVTKLDPSTRWPEARHDEVHSPLFRVEGDTQQSPLLVVDGYGGHASLELGLDTVSEHIDGNREPGLINRCQLVGRMRFPAREGWYPMLYGGNQKGVVMPDRFTPLYRSGESEGRAWNDEPHSWHDWYALKPVDLLGSAALAACSDESAAALLKGGTIDAVTHPALKQGIAGVVEFAGTIASRLERLQSRFFDEPIGRSDLGLKGVDSLRQLFDHDRAWWVEGEGGSQVGQQMLDASHYLFHSKASKPFSPANNPFPWELLLTRIGEVLYRVLAPGTSQHRREELVTVLELWLKTDFPDRLADLHLQTGVKVEGIDKAHCVILRAEPARTMIRENGTSVTLSNDCYELPAFDRAVIEQTLALLGSRGPVPFDAKISSAISKATGINPGAASLVWSAGYDPWLIGPKKRAEYGLTREALRRAEVQLMKLELREIYGRVMPTAPAELYDGVTIARLFIAAWPPPARKRE